MASAATKSTYQSYWGHSDDIIDRAGLFANAEEFWQKELYGLQIQGQLEVKKIFHSGILDIAKLADKMKFVGMDINKYPFLKKRIELTLRDIAKKLEINVVNGYNQAWSLSSVKNTVFLNKNLKNYELSDKARKIFYDPNYRARQEFIKRQQRGLNLSDRIWQNVQGFRGDMEADMLLGLSNGIPSRKIAFLMRNHLLNPEIQQSPGPGVYKSPMKNAFRLTRTETNMAYQTADFLRWNSQPFVVGIKISLSNNHTDTDQCDTLAGRYPKDFQFVGWHPQCLCHATAILITRDEMDKYQDALFDSADWDGHSVNSVNDMPEKFNKYLEENKEQINRLKNQPYWVRDNQHRVGILSEK